MDPAKIIRHNEQELAKRDANRREGMRLKPLDKHYGQRYFQYNRSETNRCWYCEDPGEIKVNGVFVCSKHIVGSLCEQ
jgi:hypothetical protein